MTNKFIYLLTNLSLSSVFCGGSLRIYERRTSPKVKKIAEDFLMNVGPEHYLQIAMMCDAAQEELELRLVLHAQFMNDNNDNDQSHHTFNDRQCQ